MQPARRREQCSGKTYQIVVKEDDQGDAGFQLVQYSHMTAQPSITTWNQEGTEEVLWTLEEQENDGGRETKVCMTEERRMYRRLGAQ